MRIGNLELKLHKEELQEPDEIKVDQAFKLVTRVDSPLYEGYNFGKYNPNQLYKKKGGYKIFDEMREDDQINAVLNLIKYIILGSAWDIECEDNEEVPEFIKKNLNEQLDEIFIKKLYNILTAIEYGFSLTEKVFEERDGKIILSTLKTRPPHSFDFQQDTYGKIIDIIQSLADGEIHLDPSKFIHYPYQEEFDNPYGKSALNMGIYRAYWCYSEDTQVLTEEGWKYFYNVYDNDKIATLNDNNELEYYKPINQVEFDYNGKMFYQSGRYIDLLTTPNHKMWVKSFKKKGKGLKNKFHFIEAKDTPRKVWYKRNAKWNGEEQEFFILPADSWEHKISNQFNKDCGYRIKKNESKKIKMDDWLKFFGIWLAEGWTYHKQGKGYYIALCQKIGEKSDIINQWLQNIGFNFCSKIDKKGKITWEISNKQLWEYLKQFGNSHIKFIPKEIKQLSSRQLKILYEAMALGDGSHNNNTYYTMSDKLADDVQEILIKIGYSAIITKQKSNGNVLINRIGRSITHEVKCNYPFDNRKWIDYQGKVYCLEVPYNKLFVRRNGKCCWSGNSKNAVIKFLNIYLERHGMPLGIGTYPKGTAQPAIDDFKKIGKNIQAKTFATMPEGFAIEFKEAQKGTDVYERAINQYNTMIARSMLLPDLLGLSGEKTGGGSYALGDKQFEIFYQTIDFERRKLERLITDEIIKPLVQWNFGNDIEAKFSFTPVDKTEKRELLKIWLDAVKSGKIPIGKNHVNWFLSNVEAPEISEEELAEIETKKEEQAAMIQGGDPNAVPKEGNPKIEEGDKKVNPADKKANEKLDIKAQEKDSKDAKAGVKEFSVGRVLNKYEKKVNFTEIENKLNELEKKYVNDIAAGFKLSINALIDEIKRKKIVEKKRFDLINKLQLKYQPSMIKCIKDMLKDSYESGYGSVTKEYLIEDLNELDEEDVANWIKYFAEQITGSEADKIAKIVKSLLGEGIRTGASIRDIIKQIDVALKGYDIALESYQIETLVRTVVSTAYNEGRGQQFGEIGDDIIGFTYSAVIDGRETDICRALDQSQIAKSDFNLYNTPNHFNCRSLLLPVFKGEGEGKDGNIFVPNAPAVVKTQGNFLELA